MPRTPRRDTPDPADERLDRRELINWLAVLGIGAGSIVTGGLGAAAETASASSPSNPSGSRPGERHGAPPGGTYVVINHEEQYSIWPSEEQPPRGWRPRTQPVSLNQAVEKLREPAEDLRFHVVINHEEQYGIWPSDYAVPGGFRVTKKDCRLTDCAGSIAEDPPRR